MKLAGAWFVTLCAVVCSTLLCVPGQLRRSSLWNFLLAGQKFRALCKKTPIFRSGWYALHYGAKTPKRHFAFSNSSVITQLSRGQLKGWKRKASESFQNVRRYVDAKGKTRFCGTKKLKQTGFRAYILLY